MNRTERFLSKISSKPDMGCWIWGGAKSGSGYGQFWNGERKIQAHHFLLEADKLEALQKDGAEACHSCDNKLCVRPSHIFVGTKSDNMKDMVTKGRHNTSPGAVAMLKVRKLHRGVNNHECKLTEAQAMEAKSCSRKRGSATALAKKFGVSLTVVCDIRDGKRWTHLPLACFPEEEAAKECKHEWAHDLGNRKVCGKCDKTEDLPEHLWQATDAQLNKGQL
jgi:hypothetical protein